MLTSKSNISIKLPGTKLKTIESRLSFQSQSQQQIATTPEQLQRIQEWQRQMYARCKYQTREQDSPIGLVIKLEEITGINYRRKEQGVKLFLKMVANLYDCKKKEFVGRTYSTTAYQLTEAKNKKEEFELIESISMFMYTYENYKDILEVKISFEVVEFKAQTVINKTNIGILTANPFAESKNKQRQFLTNHLFDQSKQNKIVVSYSIAHTEAIKSLYKLISANNIVGPEDYIAGLSNKGRLPNTNHYYRLEFTALYSFKLELIGIEMAQFYNIEILKMSKNYFELRQPKQDIKETKVKAIFLRVALHNSWKTVSKTQIELLDKKSIEVNNKTSVFKAAILQSKHLAQLPFIFFENQTVLAIELIYEVQCVTPNYNISHDFAIACYTISLAENKNNIKKKVAMKQGPFQSVSNFLPAFQTSTPIKIEFDIHFGVLENITQARQQTYENQQYDRIEIEKSRIVQEMKKVKWERRKIQMELTEKPSLPDVTDFLEETYADKIMHLKKQRDQTYAILEELKGKMDRYQIEEKQKQAELVEEKQQQVVRNKHSLFYQAVIEQRESQQSEQVSLLPHVLEIEDISEEIIKNQLAEHIFCNCFIFNFLSLQSESHKLPRSLTFSLKLFNKAALKTKPITVNPQTGQLLHIQQTKDPIQKHPIYDIQLEPHPSNPKEHYLNFLMYLLQTKLQIIILDQDSLIEFGYVLVPLKTLLRRRRQQVKAIFENEVFFRDVIKGVLRLELTNMRKQAKAQAPIEQRIYRRLTSLKSQTLRVVSNQITKIDQHKIPTELKIELEGEQRQKQRIQLLKQKQAGQSTTPKDNKKSLQEYKQQTKLSIVERVITQKVIIQKIVSPLYLVPEIVTFQFINIQNVSEEYRINILDSDQRYLAETKQLIYLTQLQDINAWIAEKYLEVQTSSLKSIKPEGTFELQKNQKITLFFKYQSFRQYTQQQSDLTKFNHSHNISISISRKEELVGIFMLRVRPENNISNLKLSYYKQANENISVILPPLYPQSYPHNLQISFNYTALLSEWVRLNSQIQIKMNTSKIEADSNNSIDFQMLVFEEDTLNRPLNVWDLSIISCEKIIVNGQLGVTSEIRINLDRQNAKQALVAYSEDQKVITTGPIQSTNGLNFFRIKVTPNFIDTHQFLVNVQKPNKQIYKRLLIQVRSQRPHYKHIFKISHQKSVPKRTQEFEYINPLPKKTVFNISTTNPYLLKPEDNKLEIAANKSKQFKLAIMAPTNNVSYFEVTLAFVDQQEQIREFILFKIQYN